MSELLYEELLKEDKLTDEMIKDIWVGVNAKNTIFAKRLKNGKGLPVLVKMEKWKTSDRVIKGVQGTMSALKAYTDKDGKKYWYLEDYSVSFSGNSVFKTRYKITNDSAKRILTAVGLQSAYKDFDDSKDAQTVGEFTTVKNYIKEGVNFPNYLTEKGVKL